MKAYKLLRVGRDGKLYPLFIDRKNETIVGKWLKAKCIPTYGFAVRKGFHCCFRPYAPHLKMRLVNGEQRVWVECEVENWKSYDRPESQGGSWILAQKMKLNRILSNEEVVSILNELPIAS